MRAVTCRVQSDGLAGMARRAAALLHRKVKRSMVALAGPCRALPPPVSGSASPCVSGFKSSKMSPLPSRTFLVSPVVVVVGSFGISDKEDARRERCIPWTGIFFGTSTELFV